MEFYRIKKWYKYITVLHDNFWYSKSADVTKEAANVEPSTATADTERLLDHFWKQSTVARRNTPPFNDAGIMTVQYGLGLIDVRDIDRDTGVADLLVWERMVSM